MGRCLITLAGLLLLLNATAARGPCKGPRQHRLEYSRAECQDLPNMCWDESAQGEFKCSMDLKNIAEAVRESKKRSSDIAGKDSVSQELDEILDKFDPNQKLAPRVKARQMKTNAKSKKRHMMAFGSPFGSLPGGDGGGLGPLLLGSSVFPKCPVNVKICHRTACGGPNAGYLQNNPKACLADPTCCYDYDLVFYRKLFGPKFMAGAPSCYYGATSKQWLYVTSLVRRWNPWLTDFILDAFDDFFDVSFLNIGGKLACKASGNGLRTACPGGIRRKKDCNLVDCCWDAKERVCFKASSYVLQALGSRQVYPALYTNDPSETKCSSNPFDYGRKAYTRHPCSIGKQPASAIDIFYKWCPQTECCVNYLGLEKSSLSDILLLSQFGNVPGVPNLFGPEAGLPGLTGGFPNFPGGFPSLAGGFPNIGGGLGPDINPALLSGLLGGGDTSIEKIFCPYYFPKLSSSLPDMTNSVKDCCEIPVCYHKKQFYGGSGGPPPTHRPTPVYGRWSGWSQCMGNCGSYGTKTRRCYLNNQEAPDACQGPSREQCQTPKCVEHARWTTWAIASCSVTCGTGTGIMRRSCTRDGVTVETQYCGGGETHQQGSCNKGPCPITYQWSELRPAGGCSATCGGGQQLYEQVCLSSKGEEVHNQFCPGYRQQKNAPCNEQPCQKPATWTGWIETSCTVTCGVGSGTFMRACLSGSRPVSTVECGGGPTNEKRPCRKAACPVAYTWSDPRPKGSCSTTCGDGKQLFVSECVSSQGKTVDPQYCQGGQGGVHYRPCNNGPCPVMAEWGEWIKGPCGGSCGKYSVREMRRSCYINHRPVDSSQCEGEDSKIEQCYRPECPPLVQYYWTGWSRASCRGPDGECLQESTSTRTCYERRIGGYMKVRPQSLCGPPSSLELKKSCSLQDCFAQ